MNASHWIMLVVYTLCLIGLGYPLGLFMARIADSDRAMPRPVAALERGAFRLLGINQQQEMSWANYAVAVVLFNLLGVFAVYLLQRLQGVLPINPAHMGAVSPDLAFNTAVSFVTNTNWQAYSGESSLGYLVQMLALTVQNFLSAATAMGVAFALARGFARRSSKTIGNFWVDVWRSSLYVLLPISIVLALVFVEQGSIQNLSAYKDVTTLEVTSYDNPVLDDAGQPKKDASGNAITEPAKTQTQTIAMGPVASQEAIKMLGTNGGGFFGANSSHPFENPTPFTNFLQVLSIFLIPAGLCFTFGRMVGDMRQGVAILIAMSLIFVVMVACGIGAELHANPTLTALGVDPINANMEGKEVRFGVFDSAFFAAVTTAASCGAVNAMHDSLMPLAGLVPLWLIEFGEVVFGGVGSGLYGMLMYAILAVFIAGLMIGRTPEYLGKKIEAFDMKMTSLALLITPFLVLSFTAIAVVTDAGTAGVSNPGAHGFSQILYAYSSAANNNGSAFGGLSVNTPFYNISLAIAMWFGRFGVIVPVLAIAGSLAAKKRIEANAGTLPTHGPLFIVLLISSVVLIGALTYIPALALGPVAEHLQLFGIK
jgi:K+-transporting ATPase ATPase A chain